MNSDTYSQTDVKTASKDLMSDSIKSNGREIEIAPGIGNRISEIANLYKTRREASEAAGVTYDSLSRYIRENMRPTFEPLFKLAYKKGVSLEWIATGEGEMLLRHRMPDNKDNTPNLADIEANKKPADEALGDIVKMLKNNYDGTSNSLANTINSLIISLTTNKNIDQETAAFLLNSINDIVRSKEI